MFGPTEMVVLLVLVLIVFGAGRLPQVFSQLGEGMKAFRKAQNEVDDEPEDVTPGKPALERKGSPEVSEAHEVRATEARRTES